MDNDSRNKQFLGQGLAFPLQVNPKGEIALVNGPKDIEQAIKIILGTRPGERVMRPQFGCRAHDLLFEPRDAATETRMQRFVDEALRRWEPRIDVQSVNVLPDDELDGALFVEINYMIKATHDPRSIVYPFFLVEEEEF